MDPLGYHGVYHSARRAVAASPGPKPAPGAPYFRILRLLSLEATLTLKNLPF